MDPQTSVGSTPTLPQQHHMQQIVRCLWSFSIIQVVHIHGDPGKQVEVRERCSDAVCVRTPEQSQPCESLALRLHRSSFTFPSFCVCKLHFHLCSSSQGSGLKASTQKKSFLINNVFFLNYIEPAGRAQRCLHLPPPSTSARLPPVSAAFCLFRPFLATLVNWLVGVTGADPRSAAHHFPSLMKAQGA